MPTLGLRSVLHTAALGYMLWGWNALNSLGGPMGEITENQYGGHWAFLTILGLWGTIATLSASLLADVTGIRAFQNVKRVVLLISLPVETIVASVYWTLILTVPSLMIPGGPAGDDSVPGADPTPPSQYFIPLPIDLALHLTPCLVLLVDFFFFERPYAPPASTYGAFLLASACGIAYGLWAEWCAQHNGDVFAYPFLTIAPLAVRIAIYAGATFGALGAFRGLNALKREEVRVFEQSGRAGHRASGKTK